MQPQDPLQPAQPTDPNIVQPTQPMPAQDVTQPPVPQPVPQPQAPQPIQQPMPQPVMPIEEPVQPVMQPQPTVNAFTPPTDPLPAAKAKNSRKGLIISLAILLVVLVFSMSGGFFLLDRSDKKAAEQSAATDTALSTTDELATDTTPTADTNNAAATELSEKAINETITDEALGTTIKVNKVRRNVPFNADLSALDKSQTSFAVEVTVTAGDKYGSTVSSSNFKLITGSKTTSESDIPFQDYVAKEKLAVFETPTRGKSATGWLFFYVSKDQAEPASLRYARGEAKVIGGTGGSIPAKQADVAL
ncbi:DUF4352 domain-containing protein [Candidatus Saccharibacteria bacterium]|nr:DUF4352 domain-containing protein [Candidatus Saccharibacteria bacterium]